MIPAQRRRDILKLILDQGSSLALCTICADEEAVPDEGPEGDATY